MKKTMYAAFMFAALMMTACKSGEETKEETTAEEPKVEETTYSLVKEESKLDWTGSWVKPTEDGMKETTKNHKGFVEFSDGTVTVKEDDVMGNFTVDMTTITVTDLGEEEGKLKLEGHLRQPDFFNVKDYSTVKVDLMDIQDGNANIVIKVMGKEITTSVPVTTKTEGDKMMLKGDFTVDFSPLEMPMTQPNPEKPEEGHVSPKVDFSLNAVLKKK
ncbi:MAG: YceI family protein [Brumimicrobium sp.]|nr:YceI family protein [Brumimicrobium sp.]